MARNGSDGTYALPESAFVFDTVIDETAVNSNFSDIASEITNSVAKDGQSTMTGTLKMGAQKITGVAVGTAQDDGVTLRQAQAEAMIWCGTAGGTADAITLTPSPAIAAYAAGQRFVWIAGASPNTGATTIAVSGLATKAAQNDGSALAAGEHAAGKLYIGIYDGTQFQISRFRIESITAGDVVGPGSATDNSLAKFDGTTGKLLKDGAVIGTDVQAHDATLDTIAALSGLTDNRLMKTDGTVGGYQETGITVDDSDGIAMGGGAITDALLSDIAEKYTDHGNSGATHTFSYLDGGKQRIVISEACVFTMPTDWPATGKSGAFVLELVNGEAFTITWPAAVLWEGNVVPTFTISGSDYLVITTDDAGTTVPTFVSGLDIS